ncbi:hypothetical protein TNCV_2715301 [Trichonephila clavipes]|nr:hypothetical protein TNCV_2715301 [Trichonephila clavipes]
MKSTEKSKKSVVDAKQNALVAAASKSAPINTFKKQSEDKKKTGIGGNYGARKIVSGEKEPSTTGVLLAPCHDEFRGPRSDYVRQADAFSRRRLKEIAFIEQIIDIKFCVRLGKSATEICKILKYLQGFDTLSRTQALSEIDVSERAGELSKTSRTAENIGKVFAAVRKNELQTIAESFGISLATCRWILTKDFNMPSVLTHRFPQGRFSDWAL